MRIAIMQGQDGLQPGTSEWDQVSRLVREQQPDILVTNEMPFGPWLASEATYSADAAAASVATHDSGLGALRDLGLPVVLSSRPVASGGRLANEAFALVRGAYRFGHHKHYFPAEPGFFETFWFRTERTGFDVVEAGDVTAGFQLCTELFFNEWARHYRRHGAHLIAVPRASPESFEQWRTAGTMAAIVSGCYVASSNRVGADPTGLIFGGRGFLIGPDGTMLGETSSSTPVMTFDLEPARSTLQRAEYPCYVAELAEGRRGGG